MGSEERSSVSGGGESPVRAARTPVSQMLGIGAVASVLGVIAALLIDWFPTAASEQAGPIDTLWDVLLIASVPVFVLVVTIVLYSAFRFRMRPGEELADGPPIHGNTRLEIIWTAIPAILLVALCSYAYVVLTDIEDAKANSLPVRVVGEQFTWTFYYQGEDGQEVASNQLYLPIDRPVNFTVQSKDVLHDFWVPAFRMKIDAVRGIDTKLRVTPNRLGTYPVVCAELCGLGHAAMRQNAHVVSPDEFDQWLSDRPSGAGPTASAGGSEGGGGEPADGNTTATVGPDLDEVVPDLSKDEIRTSIEDPDAEITDGYTPGIMPQNFKETLGEDGVTALVDYLSEVTKR